MSILSPRVRFRPAQRTDKGAAGLAFAACRTVTRWVARSQQRRQLREIAESNDFHLLKDIGVSREEAFREADKPFWRGLARDLPPPRGGSRVAWGSHTETSNRCGYDFGFPRSGPLFEELCRTFLRLSVHNARRRCIAR